ncbi:MAG: hypothetical protein JRH10_04085 [Deltaproteobacteria bacterium]|nr:hypothetical protein [Deltaproteobacteria bacterium]MBW2446365.1 hypothetical protein [Deltaproteobacteria bacterium]
MRALPALLAFALACGSTPSASRPDYFRWIGFRGLGHQMMALRRLYSVGNGRTIAGGKQERR